MILARSAGPPYNPQHLALTPGTRLGPYEITAQIGVGGPASARSELRASYGASAEAQRRMR